MDETTPGRSSRAEWLLTATRIYFNSPPEAPNNWGQIKPNHNDYHSDPMEIGSTFWSPDITDSWHQRVETYSKYPDHSNVAHDMFCIIPQGDWVEASFSLGQDVIGWRQSKTTGKTLWEQVVARQCVQAEIIILGVDYSGLDTTDTETDLELNKQVEEWKLHKMAKLDNFLEMWQGTQNLHAIQKEYCTHNS